MINMGTKRSQQQLVIVAAWAVLFIVAYWSLIPSHGGVGFVSRALGRSGIRPRFIFVDLGANRADSLDAFLGKTDAKFQFEFPRPDWARYDQADIYLFEGNPVFNPALVEAKQRCLSQGINVNIFPSTIVDVKDGTRTFFLDTVNDAHDYWGSSTYAQHPDAVSSGSNGTELTSINISRWLLMNTLPHDFVVVKIDIEGSEYDVIPHMVEMSAWKVIDYLLIEWHETLPDEIALAKAKAAADKLVAEGVKMPPYSSPA